MMEHEKKDDVIEFKIPKFTTEKIRKNPWIISTFVFVVLSLVLMWNNYAGSGFRNISSEKASEILETFLSDSSGTQITVKNIVLENGLYKASVDYQGNEIALYMTKDGNYLIQDLIPLTNTDDDGENIGGLVSASEDDEAVLGDENAPVTIIEFSDYQCPFCRKFWTETYPELKSQYVDTGKAKIIFRDLPLDTNCNSNLGNQLHPMACKSAEAAECVREKAGDSGYWKFHDKIFSEQNILDSGSAIGSVTKTVIYTDDDLKKWAKDLGYEISSCLDSGKYKSEIMKDISDAGLAGGSGTPYFVIKKSGEEKGTALSGAQPLSAFKAVIDGMS